MKEEKNDQTEKPQFSNWQEAWEYYAGRANKTFNQLPESELLELIKQRKFDLYYTIWDAIGNKGTIQNSSLVLYNVLVNENKKHDDLIRYHCAGALFKILGLENEEELRKHCQWDLGDRDESLKKLLKIINSLLKDQKRV